MRLALRVIYVCTLLIAFKDQINKLNTNYTILFIVVGLALKKCRVQ